METGDFLEFGPFRLDPGLRTLARNGEPVSLPGKAFDVLLVLVRRPGETVTKEELMRSVWPDVFVEEGNLTQTIFVLRKALEDSDGQPLIVTIPRQGYRFAGAVTTHAKLASAGAKKATIGDRFPAAKWMVLALSLLAAGWIAARWQGNTRMVEVSPARFTVAAPEGTIFREGRVSPDGQWLAFIGFESAGVRRLWVRRLDSLTARPLARAAGTPIWSYDSRFIAFGDEGKLKRINVRGGAIQVVCDASLVVGGSWSSGDNIIFAGGGDEKGTEILLVKAGDSKAKNVTRLDPKREENQHSFPVFLPDGRHFLYTIQSARPEFSGVFVGSLDDPGARIRLAEDVSNAEYALAPGTSNGYLLFVRGSALMAQPFDASSLRVRGEAFPLMEKVALRASVPGGSFSASHNGVIVVSSPVFGNQLTWFERSGRRAGTIGEPGLYLSPQISPDQKTVVSDSVEPATFSTQIWLFPSVGNASRFTFVPAQSPVWSPDGKRIAYETVGKALYDKPASGTEDATLLLAAGQPAPVSRVPCDWSRDGRFLIYAEAGQRTGFDLWKLPAAGDRKPVVLLSGIFNEFCGSPSPDGRWIAYSSDESGRAEIYVQPLPAEGPVTGRKWQVSYGGGAWPKWGREGKELYYLDAAKNMIAVDVAGGNSFQPGTPRPLFATGIHTPDARFDVTPDGNRFIIPTETSGAASMAPTVILNWASTFKP